MMNDTLSPLVSIIICVYNGEKYLERCLQSAMSQSYKNIEIIVVNDGSMDNTPVIIENYVKLDCRIIVISKQNGGISILGLKCKSRKNNFLFCILDQTHSL